MHFSSLFIPVFLAVHASAHGFIAEAHIGGHKYEGNSVGNPPKDSVIWQLGDVSAVKGATNKQITCGHGAHQAKLVADAMPGDTMTFDWRDGDGGKHWPHDMGPLLTYMASCGSKPCNEFDPSNANWFKIMESGMQKDSSWKQAGLKSGDTIHATIPKNLAPGNYMVRSEIIALHLANDKGGAEFYVDCLQLRVGGRQTGKPSSRDTVKFPGGYSNNDPGIFVPKIYDHMQPSDYVIPGPKIASFITGSSNEGDSSNDDSNNGDDSSQASGQDSSPAPQGGQQNNSGQAPASGKVSQGKEDGGKDDSASSQPQSEDAEECDDDENDDEGDGYDSGDNAAESQEGKSTSDDSQGDKSDSSQAGKTESGNDEEQSAPPAANSSAQSSNEKDAQQCDPNATRARHTSRYSKRSATREAKHLYNSRLVRMRRSLLAH
ncbi:hypothetical protein V5O48_002914 [Marasmius crinis-equi]|uniref:lytic cellulose monooxygenase (C4-dehydrogenating) n=1 Tax=Marasmius crinis-equi TaxID=585013 RepID=A0ABR3FU89_9AGAR